MIAKKLGLTTQPYHCFSKVSVAWGRVITLKNLGYNL